MRQFKIKRFPSKLFDSFPAWFDSMITLYYINASVLLENIDGVFSMFTSEDIDDVIYRIELQLCS